MEFIDARFMTADEKRSVLKQWGRFTSSGFDRRYFTDGIYNHLTLHCSFIAHYDRAGFYSVYFEDKENTGRFIDQFTTGISAEYGMKYWLAGDYSDINLAMCEVIEEYAPGLRNNLDNAIKDEDLRKAQRLLAKHCKKFVIEDL